jgi:hypothetical protein
MFMTGMPDKVLLATDQVFGVAGYLSRLLIKRLQLRFSLVGCCWGSLKALTPTYNPLLPAIPVVSLLLAACVVIIREGHFSN